MVEDLEESVKLNALETILTDGVPSRSSRNSKGACPRSRRSSALIASAFRRWHGRGPFCHGDELAKSGENLSTFSRLDEAASPRDGGAVWVACADWEELEPSGDSGLIPLDFRPLWPDFLRSTHERVSRCQNSETA